MVDHQGGHNHDKKRDYGFSHQDLRVDHVVAQVEKSVNLIIDQSHRLLQRHGSREQAQYQKDYKGTSRDEGETKTKYNELPTMIDTGGWVRPNRAMWASPPNSSSSLPQNNT